MRNMYVSRLNERRTRHSCNIITSLSLPGQEPHSGRSAASRTIGRKHFHPLPVSGIIHHSTYSITRNVRSQRYMSHYSEESQSLAEKIVNTCDTTRAEPEYLRA